MTRTLQREIVANRVSIIGSGKHVERESEVTGASRHGPTTARSIAVSTLR